MTGLLDTCTLLWFDREPNKLSPAARAFLADPSNVILLSVASAWEIVIKVPTGKLELAGPVEELVARQLANDTRLLGISLDHVCRVGLLPSIHRDPFDRLLIAQALVEGAAVLTPDPLIRQYPVPTVW